MRKDRSGGEYGICTLKDGTKCEEWSLFRGDCPREPRPIKRP